MRVARRRGEDWLDSRKTAGGGGGESSLHQPEPCLTLAALCPSPPCFRHHAEGTGNLELDLGKGIERDRAAPASTQEGGMDAG